MEGTLTFFTNNNYLVGWGVWIGDSAEAIEL